MPEVACASVYTFGNSLPSRVRTLRQHAFRHDQIGPIKVSIGKLFGVAVYEPAFPRIGQQRRDGDQAERGGRESGVIKFAGSSKIPERLPVETRRHQENFVMLRHSSLQRQGSSKRRQEIALACNK